MLMGSHPLHPPKKYIQVHPLRMQRTFIPKDKGPSRSFNILIVDDAKFAERGESLYKAKSKSRARAEWQWKSSPTMYFRNNGNISESKARHSFTSLKEELFLLPGAGSVFLCIIIKTNERSWKAVLVFWKCWQKRDVSQKLFKTV